MNLSLFRQYHNSVMSAAPHILPQELQAIQQKLSSIVSTESSAVLAHLRLLVTLPRQYETCSPRRIQNVG